MAEQADVSIQRSVSLGVQARAELVVGHDAKHLQQQEINVETFAVVLMTQGKLCMGVNNEA